jgi:hypothetical protein
MNDDVRKTKVEINESARKAVAAGKKDIVVDNSLSKHVDSYRMTVTQVFEKDEDNPYPVALGTTDKGIPCVLFL